MLSLTTAGSTAAIAWLLDPAMKNYLLEQDKRFALNNSSWCCFSFFYKRIYHCTLQEQM